MKKVLLTAMGVLGCLLVLVAGIGLHASPLGLLGVWGGALVGLAVGMWP